MSELWSRVRTAWDNLSPNERLLLSILGGMFAVFVLTVAVVNPFLAATDNARSQVETAERQLEMMKRLVREYRDVGDRLSAVESRIRDPMKRDLLYDLAVAREQLKQRDAAMPELEQLDKVYLNMLRMWGES